MFSHNKSASYNLCRLPKNNRQFDHPTPSPNSAINTQNPAGTFFEFHVRSDQTSQSCRSAFSASTKKRTAHTDRPNKTGMAGDFRGSRRPSGQVPARVLHTHTRTHLSLISAYLVIGDHLSACSRDDNGLQGEL